MPKDNKMESLTRTLITPIIEENKFELVDVEFLKEGPNWYLRVFIDKEGGITIDDCELISRSLEKLLDKADPLEQGYILEVSSPGIDRPLKKDSDFIKYAGEPVDIKLYKPFEGKKEYHGTLLGLKDDVVTIIAEDGKTFQFTRKEIGSIRLAVIF